MTRKRGEWWAKLSPKERALRSEIRRLEGMTKHYKYRIPLTKNNDDYCKYNMRQVNEYNALIRALKHELVRGGTATVKLNRSGFYCSNCAQFVQKFDNYCPVCGKKLNWTVAKEQYEQHHLLEMAEGFLGNIKSCKSNNQKLYCIDRAREMLNALEAEYKKGDQTK